MSNIWINYSGKGLKYGSGIKVSYPGSLPAIAQKTLRFDFKYDHFNPLTYLPDYSASGFIWTHIQDDIYDFNYDYTNWISPSTGTRSGGLFNIYYNSATSSYPMTQHEFDIIDSDLTGVTNIKGLFQSAWRAKDLNIKHVESVVNASYAFGHGSRTMYITSINDLNMPALEDASSMFNGCGNLTGTLPFVTGPNITNASYMYLRCSGVTSGAVAMYNYLSTKSVAVTSHDGCFSRCSTTEERAQIPSSWGG